MRNGGNVREGRSSAIIDARSGEPDRRAILVALALLPSSGAASPLSAPAKVEPPAPPLRRIALRAAPYTARPGGPEAPEAMLARFEILDAEGRPSAAPDPFPSIRVKAGERIEITVHNALAEPCAFHIRGLRGPNAADPVPGLVGMPIPPGGTQLLAFPARQTGTFLIQAILPETIAAQNARGLAAALIVGEVPAPRFDHDLVLAVADWRLVEAGAFADDALDRRDTARLGRLGNRLVANNAPAPAMLTVRPGARLRVRVINTANARLMPLRVTGFPALVYAIDSTPCQPFDPLKRTVIMAPGTRVELVIDAPREAGRRGIIEARIGEGTPIMTLLSEGEPLPPGDAIIPLPDPGLPPAIRLQDATRAEFAITGGIGREADEADPAALAKRFPDPRRIYLVNGAPGGFSGKPLARVRRGRVLVLALHNRTAWPQVIAVHGHSFRLLHAFDDGWEPYFLDTLYLAPGTTARIALIADNPGKWAIRSTIAEHFAAGVATWFEVT